MKNYIKFTVLSALFCLLLFIQAQDFKPSNDPNIDHMIFGQTFNIEPPRFQPLVVTAPDGYDNFNIAVNNAEVFQTTNPINPAGIFNAYNTNSGHWTADGWTFTNTTPTVPSSSGDPWSGADSLGNLYYITLNGNLTGSWVVKSTNFGQTWGSAVAACTGNDRETIAVDATGGPYAGYVYCGETPGNFSRSTNGGVSFTQTASMSNTLPGFMMTVGAGPTGISGGAVYVVTSTGSFSGTPTFTFYRSTDGGATFNNVSTQNGWVNVVGTIVNGRNSYNNMRLRPYPFIYADNSFGTHRGRAYVFYSANNPGGDGNKPSIYIRYSDDGCVTFSAPVIINDDANPTASAHFQEQGWCDKSTGRLYCQWMDTRNSPAADSAEIFASLSTDGGVTWAPNQRISTAKMIINCPCGVGGPPAYQGDYTGCSSNGNIADLAWTDYRNATFGSYFGYFPDYAMKINPSSVNMGSLSDSAFVMVSVPSVKLYSYSVKFTASIASPPATGTISMTYLNRTTNLPVDSLSVVPDSIKLRITTSGLVTPGSYIITATSHGPQGTPVHKRDITVNISPIGIQPISTQVPNSFYLYQNYPNPFNPSTNIRIDLAKTGLVKLTVYDITGRKVEELLNSNYAAGKYSFSFDASKYATGVYFYKLETPEYTSIKKMMLIK